MILADVGMYFSCTRGYYPQMKPPRAIYVSIGQRGAKNLERNRFTL